MTVTTATLAGRRAAEKRMVDSCTVTRSLTARQFNVNTGEYIAATSVTIYSGPCEVQIASLGDATTPTVEGGDPTIQQLLVKLPVDDTVYRIQDLVTITTARLDPLLVGRTFRVTATHGKTFATARRLQCEEVTNA